METFVSSLCPNCPAVRTGGDIVKPVTIMKSGVFNGAKKDVDSLRESTRLWNGKDILLYKNSEGIFDHPFHKMGGLSTDPELIVGQVRDPVWDEDNQRIRAVAHFFEDKAPPWLIQAVMNNEKLGVSGAFFCEKLPEEGVLEGVQYDRLETKFVPNNLAIVDSPACKLPYCGINVNSHSEFTNEEVTKMVVDDTQKVTADEKNITVNVIMPKVEEKKMVEEDDKGITLELESQKKIVVEKDQVIATKDAEILSLNSKLKAATDKLQEIATKFATEKFLSQFPEVNREKAKTELLPMFLENPAELVLNAVKMNSLMSIEGSVKGEGKEFVVVPETNSVDAVYDEMGVPSVDDLKKRFGL